MSGLEVVGVLASTAQIAVYVIKVAACLSEVYERLKNAPDRIRHHAHHIKCLLDIVQHIQVANSPDSPILSSQLQSTLSQACDLRNLIDKALGQYTQPSLRRRYWKVLKGNKEKQILAALENLEREKSGLTLCLTAATHTELLKDVKRESITADTNMSSTEYPPSPAPTSDGSEPSKSEAKSDKSNANSGTSHGQEVWDEKTNTLTNNDSSCGGESRHNAGYLGKGSLKSNIEVNRAKSTEKGILNSGIIESEEIREFFKESSK